MGWSEGKNFKRALKGQRVETDSKTEVNSFFSIIDNLEEVGKCRTSFKYSWFDLIFSIDCINSWEEKVCIIYKIHTHTYIYILSNWVNDCRLNRFLPYLPTSLSHLLILFTNSDVQLLMKQWLKCSEMRYLLQHLEFLIWLSGYINPDRKNTNYCALWRVHSKL